MINADHESECHFTKKDLARLQTFADEVAPVIAERISVPNALQEITVELTRETQEADIDKLLRLIAKKIRKEMNEKLKKRYPDIFT